MRARASRTAAAVLAALAASLLTGCEEEATPERPPPLATASAVPAATLEQPTAAAMALVPRDATTLEVTDFAEIRLQLGFGELTGASPAAERAEFWRRAEQDAPLLSRGMLRGPGAGSEARYGFGQDDVAWEAHFAGDAGEGWVVVFRDDLPIERVAQAAAAADGPLAGGTVVPDVHGVALGTTADPAASWAADPDLLALVGNDAGASLLSRACVPPDDVAGAEQADAELETFDELEAFSLTFGGTLVTARLGPLRNDTFERARLVEDLPATDPAFETGYADAVADPESGRIGWTLADGSVAAELALAWQLPFAVCG